LNRKKFLGTQFFNFQPPIPTWNIAMTTPDSGLWEYRRKKYMHTLRGVHYAYVTHSRSYDSI